MGRRSVNVAVMQLYHTGYHILREPDLRIGRKNADFGQGFYLSPDRDFAGRWAMEHPGAEVFVNAYRLETNGLRVRQMSRDERWYEYIFRNRAGYGDSFPEDDVIVGPVANDTLYNTFGIFTSGLLEKETALRLLCVGPEFTQIAVKTERALSQLHWLSAHVIPGEELRRFRTLAREEEERYQRLLAEAFEEGQP